MTEKERYIERWASTVVINVDLSHDIDIELSRSTIQFGTFQDNDGIALKRKTNTLIKRQASDVAINFVLGHDLDIS